MRISTVGPRSGVRSGPVDGYLRPDQFLDHLTVIKICYFVKAFWHKIDWNWHKSVDLFMSFGIFDLAFTDLRLRKGSTKKQIVTCNGLGQLLRIVWFIWYKWSISIGCTVFYPSLSLGPSRNQDHIFIYVLSTLYP